MTDNQTPGSELGTVTTDQRGISALQSRERVANQLFLMGQRTALEDSEQRLRPLAVVLAHARGKLEQRTKRSDDLVMRPVGNGHS